MLIQILKEYGHPGSPAVMAAALLVATVWLWRSRRSFAARAYVTLLTVGYWLVSTPVGARLLVSPLAPAIVRVESREAAHGADTVVLLGGGIGTATVGGHTFGVPTVTTLFRALEAARAFTAIDGRLLIASGGVPRPDRQAMPESALLRRIVVDAGVPADRVVDESQSTTTAEQARLVGDLLAVRGVRRAVIVTSPVSAHSVPP